METVSKTSTILKDLTAGLVVFLVALPLCLGVALASNAPLMSGILSGIIGGVIVGLLSGSHSSVSGPAAGLTAVVAAQIALFEGSFESFLTVVFLAGLIQIVIGLLQAGSIAEFFPTSVIKGLLSAIGIILILKQIPHLFGHDKDPDGEMSFRQPDNENTFSELFQILSDLHWGASLIGLASLGLLIAYNRISIFKSLKIPGPLVVVLFGIVIKFVYDSFLPGTHWQIGPSHLVQIPVAENISEFTGFLQMADFSQLTNPLVYTAAITVALVASLETLLNLEAVDKIDPQQRTSPPNRELVAQGVGNMCAGLIGAIPVTSVIIRSSVNINSGGRTKAATVFHGILLFVCAALLPQILNHIPLSCLAAILLLTGIKLASPDLFRQMWRGGWNEFIPFIVTTIAIVFTDLLIGILIGLGVSIAFILKNSLRRPIRRIMEKHISGNVLRIQLSNQVSFLNRGALNRVFDEIQDGEQVVIDASQTDYIDPDVRHLIHEFEEVTAPARGIIVSLVGFKHDYQFENKIQYVDYSSRDVQEKMTPEQALQLVLDGNERFQSGRQISRNFERQVSSTSQGQYPIAVVLSCIDSRTPAELIFDMGLGDIFSVRVAGNVISPQVLGSMEYGCAKAGSKLLLVVGHTRCGAVTASVELACNHQNAAEATGCDHIGSIVDEVDKSIDDSIIERMRHSHHEQKIEIVDEIARLNVQHTVDKIRELSAVLRTMEINREIAIVGAMYDVTTGQVELITHPIA